MSIWLAAAATGAKALLCRWLAEKIKRGAHPAAPRLVFMLFSLGSCCNLNFFRKHRLEPLHFIPIMQKHNGHDSHRLFAEMALHAFSLKVLQEPVCKPVLGPLAPCFLLAFRAAMRTLKFHRVRLRIALQSRPARAAYPDNFRNLPIHQILLPPLSKT